jgi:hypothetical protein
MATELIEILHFDFGCVIVTSATGFDFFLSRSPPIQVQGQAKQKHKPKQGP